MKLAVSRYMKIVICGEIRGLNGCCSTGSFIIVIFELIYGAPKQIIPFSEVLLSGTFMNVSLPHTLRTPFSTRLSKRQKSMIAMGFVRCCLLQSLFVLCWALEISTLQVHGGGVLEVSSRKPLYNEDTCSPHNALISLVIPRPPTYEQQNIIPLHPRL